MRSRLLSRVARLSVRWRVTLAFTAVMAVLLGATGLYVYVRLGSALDDSLDRGLDGRAADVVALLQRSAPQIGVPGTSPLRESGERFAQLLTPAGVVVDSTAGTDAARLVPPATLPRARRGSVSYTATGPFVRERELRLVARPATIGGRHYVVAVGSSLEPNDDARSRLAGLLLVGGPIALLLAALAGYGAVAASLRPVELMRRRAATIRAGRPDRLPVPDTHDEIAALGTTLNDMLERLDRAFTRERRFVDDASHELRTPLTILRAELELAMRDARTAEDFREAVASAGEETERLVRLADDLLVITRADQGRLPVRRTTFRPPELLDVVAARFSTPAREARITLVVDSGDGLELDADRALLERALGNLVDNALRHARKTVTLRARGRTLHVVDDGPGFDEAFLGQAFDRFARAEHGRGRDSGGAGLGMAIAASIAEAHGGRTFARNVPGGGADVGIELPAR